MKKRTVITIIAIVGCICGCLIISSVFKDVPANREKAYNLFSLIRVAPQLLKRDIDFGIQSINVTTTRQDDLVINIKQIGCRGYSVEVADEDEQIAIGETHDEYNGDLGKNLIKIVLYDAEVSEKLHRNYSNFQVYEIPDATNIKTAKSLKFMLVPASDHSIIIYVGSDEPLNITEQGFTLLEHSFSYIVIDFQ